MDNSVIIVSEDLFYKYDNSYFRYLNQSKNISLKGVEGTISNIIRYGNNNIYAIKINNNEYCYLKENEFIRKENLNA